MGRRAAPNDSIRDLPQMKLSIRSGASLDSSVEARLTALGASRKEIARCYDTAELQEVHTFAAALRCCLRSLSVTEKRR